VKSSFELIQKREENLCLRLEVAKEELESTRLGDHSNIRVEIYTEYGVSLARRFLLNQGIRIDHHSEWSWQFSPAMNIGYHLSWQVTLHSSFGRSFRPPDYTELYYWSPQNVGNPRVVAEEAWSSELGGDFGLNAWLHSRATLLFRNERNLID
jgi:iron complex outermembrane receptor protein